MISSVTVTFNPDLSILKNQLEQLEKSLDRILIVDNNSDALIQEELKTLSYSKLEIISNSENLGLAKAINLGLERAFGDSDFAFLFDHDSIPEEGFSTTLLNAYNEYYKESGQAALFGPLIYDRKLKRNLPFVSKTQNSNSLIEVHHLYTSGTLISKEVYKKIGGLNPDFFIDQLDVEYCLRANHYGIKSFGVKDSVLSHSIGDEFFQLKFFNLTKTIMISSPGRNYYMVRNMIFLLKSEYPDFKWKLRNFLQISLRSFYWIVFLNRKLDRMRWILKGFLDGIMNKSGKLS